MKPSYGCSTWARVLLFCVLSFHVWCGCRNAQHHTDLGPPGAPAVIGTEFRREHHRAFSPDETRILNSALRHLEHAGKRPVDAYYHVRHTEDGYEVFVLNVTGYDGTQPIFRPCNDCAVLLKEDGTVLKVLRGPAAWP